MTPQLIAHIADRNVATVIEEKENHALILEEVARVFGRHMGVRCTAAGEARAARPLTEDDVRPMIERAVQWFEGEVIERPGQGAERMQG